MNFVASGWYRQMGHFILVICTGVVLAAGQATADTRHASEPAGVQSKAKPKKPRCVLPEGDDIDTAGANLHGKLVEANGSTIRVRAAKGPAVSIQLNRKTRFLTAFGGDFQLADLHSATQQHGYGQEIWVWYERCKASPSSGASDLPVAAAVVIFSLGPAEVEAPDKKPAMR